MNGWFFIDNYTKISTAIYRADLVFYNFKINAISQANHSILLLRADKSTTAKTSMQREVIIDYLTNYVTATSSKLAELIDVKNSRIKEILCSLTAEVIIFSSLAVR